MTTARANAGGALVGDDLYVIGGSSTSGPRSLTEVYDTQGNIWRAAAALPVGLEQFGIATDGDEIYVAGGYETTGAEGTHDRESNSFWIFDVSSGAWSSGPDMPGSRVGLSLACVDGKVYAIGGRGPNAARIFVYDLGKKSWSISRISNPSPRADSAVVVVGDAVYVIGGSSGNGASARVDIFDVGRGVWRNGPAMPSPREGHVAALLDGQIHVSGGQSISPPKSYPDHFVLNLKTGKWSKAAPLPMARHGSIAAGTRGKFFVVGGAPGAGVYTVFTSSDVVDIYSDK
jgi:N-acetylneuraminic acid mutarotase